MTSDPRPDLPAPLVPADCDCTDLDGFMLNVERLMASELVALSSHEVVAAALFLWCRAWKQRPAASLPNDERVMAAFARLPLPRFRKLRDEVLRGFVLCSDGRLYHRVLAKEALRAFERKAAFRRKRETDAERLRKWRSSQTETRSETVAETRFETQSETRFVAEGQGQGQGQGSIERGGGRDAHAHARGDPIPEEGRNQILDLTERVIAAVGADPSKSPTWMTAGMEVSKWVRAGYDPELDILPAIATVMAKRPEPPEGPRYFLKAIARHHHERTSAPPNVVIDQHRQETIHVAAQPARPTFDRFAAEDARRERGRRHLASMVGPVGPRDGAADGGYD